MKLSIFAQAVAKAISFPDEVEIYIAAGVGVTILPAQFRHLASVGVTFVPLADPVPSYRYVRFGHRTTNILHPHIRLKWHSGLQQEIWRMKLGRLPAC